MTQNEDKELLIDYHCVCIRFTSPKKRKEIIESFKKESRAIKKELKKIDLSVYRAIGPFNKKLMIMARIRPKKEEVNQKHFFQAFPFVQRLVKVTEPFGIKKFDGTSCSMFSFNSKKYKLVGELLLPASITLKPELIDRIGKPKLSGLIISFDESPIGLDTVKIERLNENVSITASTEYKFDTVENFIMNTYNHSKMVTDLFVEEK